MKSENLNHFLEFSKFDFPGGYLEDIRALPDEVASIGKLIRQNVIHRTTLAAGNVGTNRDKRFGDMDLISKLRQPDDDYLVTAAAMLAELYRLDSRGLVEDREVTNKIVVTCRFVAVLINSILKSKRIPVRVRSGFAGYFDGCKGEVWDHWVNEYWNGERWVLIDVDGSFSMDASKLNPYDLPEGAFIFGHQAWVALRQNKEDPKKYQNAGGYYGVFPTAWALIHDFHAIMNNPVTYLQTAKILPFALGESWKGQQIGDHQVKKLDELAVSMEDFDANWSTLKKLWEDSDLRLVKGGLI